eukprot:3553910-Prymnesium_polylepis.1
MGSSRDELLAFWENGFRVEWEERSFVHDEDTPFVAVGEPERALEELERHLHLDDADLRPVLCVGRGEQRARLG